MKRLLMTVAALLVLVVMVAWMAGLLTPRVAPSVDPLPAPEASVRATVQAVAVRHLESVPASVEARDTTLVASRLLARVRALSVRPGDTVQQGQVLAKLEASDLMARLKQAEENLNSVAARANEAALALDRAENLRQRQLIAQADLDAARATMTALAAQRSAAEQSVQEAQTALSWSEIVAPIAGRVVERMVEPGDTVNPGQPLVSLYNPSTLRVEAWVREALAVSLAPGQVLSVSVPTLNASTDASIEEIVPAADPGSRSFKIRLLMPLIDGLVPGMYARVSVPAGEGLSLRIPADFVRRVGQLDLVWVEGKAGPERRFIRVGKQVDGKVEVISGLSEGEVLLQPGEA